MNERIKVIHERKLLLNNRKLFKIGAAGLFIIGCSIGAVTINNEIQKHVLLDTNDQNPQPTNPDLSTPVANGNAYNISGIIINPNSTTFSPINPQHSIRDSKTNTVYNSYASTVKDVQCVIISEGQNVVRAFQALGDPNDYNDVPVGTLYGENHMLRAFFTPESLLEASNKHTDDNLDKVSIGSVVCGKVIPQSQAS